MKYRISFLKAYEIYLSSIFFVNVIPTAAVSGEVAKIYFVQKADPGSRFDRTLAAGLMSRILEIIPVSLGAIGGVLYVAIYYHIPTWALAFCIVIAAALAVAATIILAVAMNNELLRRLTAWSVALLGKLFKSRAGTSGLNTSIASYYSSGAASRRSRERNCSSPRRWP